MTGRKFITKGVFPLIALLILTWLGRYIFIVNGEIDWFRACLVYGVPFGIPYMLFVIPLRSSVGSTVAVLVLSIIAGALFGCIIAAIGAIRAAYYVIGYPVSMLIRKIKNSTI